MAVFAALPQPAIIAAMVLGMGAITAWGLKESVAFAGAMTLIEIGGLVVLVTGGALFEPNLLTPLPEMVPPSVTPAALVGLAGATLLAVFAFIGLAALVIGGPGHVSEERRDPERTLPRGIFLTSALSTLLYVLVAADRRIPAHHEPNRLVATLNGPRPT